LTSDALDRRAIPPFPGSAPDSQRPLETFRRVLDAERQCDADLAARAAETLVRERRLDRRIPRRLWPLLGAPDETPAMRAVRSFLAPEDDRVLLVLAGAVGTGKTVACGVALDGHPGLFVKAFELTQAGAFDAAFWDALRRTPLLVVDDLGTEPRDEKGWAAACLLALVDHRYDWLLKTIFTTNLDDSRFKATYCRGAGARTLDRLREAGAFVAVPGGSRRRPPGASAP
jgi:hypothetical protein